MGKVEERRRLIERTKAGLERARREGKQIGRPRAHVDMAEARALLASRVSTAKTARKLNVGTSTLYRLLRAERTMREAGSAGSRKEPPSRMPITVRKCPRSRRGPPHD